MLVMTPTVDHPSEAHGHGLLSTNVSVHGSFRNAGFELRITQMEVTPSDWLCVNPK